MTVLSGGTFEVEKKNTLMELAATFVSFEPGSQAQGRVGRVCTGYRDEDEDDWTRSRSVEVEEEVV